MLIMEAAKKTADQYYGEKFGRLDKFLKDVGVFHEWTEVAIATRQNETAIIAASESLKTDSQMEYFLFWLKLYWLLDLKNICETMDTFKSFKPFTNAPLQENDPLFQLVQRDKKVWEMVTTELKQHVMKGKKRGLKDKDIIYRTIYSLKRWAGDISHFLSLGIHDIDTYNFFTGFLEPFELSAIFKEKEEEYFKKFGGYLLPKDLDQGEEVVCKFSIEGKNFIWVNTHNPTTCDKETKLMKHCGNSYHAHLGGEAYSLREILVVDGKTAYDPMLTFIIKDKTLNESKGSTNMKPSKKYFPHIVELLKTGHILHIWQKESYMPQNNWYFTDLPKEMQREVEDKFAEEGWEFKLEDESMDYSKQLEDSHKLVKEANKAFKFVSLDMNDDDDSIMYSCWGSFTLPFLSEEFWDKWGEDFEKRFTENGIRDDGGEGLQYEELEDGRNYVRFSCELREGFDMSSGEAYGDNGRTGQDLITTTKDAIQSVAYWDGEVASAVSKVLEKIVKEKEVPANMTFPFAFENVMDLMGDMTLTKDGLRFDITHMTPRKFGEEIETPEEILSILKVKTINFLKKRVLRNSDEWNYGKKDLLGEPISKDEKLEKINDLVVTVDGKKRYYSEWYESITIHIDAPKDIYNLLEKYISSDDLQELKKGINGTIHKYCKKKEPDGVPARLGFKEHFNWYIRNR